MVSTLVQIMYLPGALETEQDLLETHFQLNTRYWIALTFPFLHEQDQEGIGKERVRDQ